MRRARAEWPVLLAAYLVLLVSVTLIAAGVIYGDAVAAGGVQRALRDAPATGQAMLVTTAAAPDEVDGTDAVARAELHAAMTPVDGVVSLLLGSGPWVVAGSDADPDAPPPPLVRIAAIEAITDHATLVEGAWPAAGADPVEVSLSEGAAGALGVRVGDRVALTGRADPDATVDAVVRGVWRPEPADRFWFGDAMLLEGTQTAGSFTTVGPLVMDRDDLLARAPVPQLDLVWRAFPAVERLSADDVGALAASVASADERLRSALPPPPAITLTSDLPATLASVGTSVTVSRAGVLVLTLEFAVLAGYAIVMVGGMLADRRRGEVALLRTRGASTGALVAMSLLEATLLTVPAVIVAPILGLILVRIVAQVGPLAGTGAVADPVLTPMAFGAAIVAGVGCLVALAAPAVHSASSPAGERAATARPVGRGLAGRRVVDLVLLALASVALWQLRLYGAPLTRDARGTLGVDPLLIAAPALTLLAGALLGTRLLPRLAELLSPAAGRARGAVAPLATWGLARRPQRATRAALLLMLAAALGAFAATYQATWARSQADQATQRAGADVRAVMSDYPELPAWAVGPAIRSRPGVEGASAVGIRSLDSGRVIRNGTLVATEPEGLATVMADRGAASPGSLPAVARVLADDAPSPPGMAIPADATGLGLTIAGLRTSDLAGTPIAAPTGTVEAVAVVTNADGVHRLPLGRVTTAPGPVTITGLLGGDTAAGALTLARPARLLAVELVVTAGAGELVTGELALTDLQALGAGAPVDLDPMPDDRWAWRALDFGTLAEPVETTPVGTVPIGTDPGGPPPIFGSPDPPTTFRFQPPATASELSAVATDAFLAATGARIGDNVAATVSGLPVTLRLIDSVAAVPTRDPSMPVVVVDAATLAAVEYLTLGRVVPARDWWLAADPADAPEVLAAMRTSPFGATDATGREVLAAALAADPVALGVIGALALGSIAALAMAAVGFVLSASVSAAERLGEFAVLRALGLSGRELGRWLLLETAAMLVFGLVAGTALGLLLAWLVLPFAALTQTGLPPVPPATLVVPWDAIVPVFVVGGLLLLGSVAIAIRRVPMSGLGGLLRAKVNP